VAWQIIEGSWDPFGWLVLVMSSTVDAATQTGRILQRCISAILLIFVASVVFAPPKHFVHWIVMGVYSLILVGGLVGATKQIRGLLRVYWISQFIVLVLTLGAIIFGIVVMFQEMKHPQVVEIIATSTTAGDANGSSTTSSTTTSGSATTTTVDGSSSTDTTTTTTTIGGTQSEIDHHQTMTASRGSPAFFIINIAYLVVFLLILAIKVRSILLAQKLLKQMDEHPYMEDSQIELESQQVLSAGGSEYSVVETQQYSQPANASQPIYLVQAHYVPNGQPEMTGMPMVLIDQYGNVVSPQ